MSGRGERSQQNLENSIHDPEQDLAGEGDGLPSYEDLAAQKGPNSRFGRWKGWVEKRAAERYLHITPEERTRQRNRGWGDGVVPEPDNRDFANDPALQTSYPPSYAPRIPSPTPLLTSSQPLPPSHLELHSFGSRFLPHTTSPIRTVLPLLGDRLLLIGHDDGLSVLDMFPTADPGSSGPAEAVSRSIWEGEGVYQLEILEYEDSGGFTPRGVVLALVGSEVESPSGKEPESLRTLRMYNLASLISLARWAIAQKGSRPLDLRRPKRWTPQQASHRKHKHHASLAKGLKALISESPSPSEATDSCRSYSTMISPSSSDHISASHSLSRTDSNASAISSWDVVEDFPLRWAADYVPLAASGSRLSNVSALLFELRRDEYRGHRGHTLLAIATKSSVLLYETPKGERAFRFVKEFYTPLQARSITFVYQRALDHAVPVSGSEPSQSALARHFSPRSSGGSQSRFASPAVSDYGDQLSLFVTFDGKAGLIRLADSHVSEVELSGENFRDVALPSGAFPRRARASSEVSNPAKEGKLPWLPPCLVDLPIISQNGWKSRSVYVMTRGKQTYILSYPLLVPLYNQIPLITLTWLSQPSFVAPRICHPIDKEPFLQLIALGELGAEVQEIAFPTPLSNGKGKNKERLNEFIRVQVDVGGDAGFLRHGGLWHQSHDCLTRSNTITTFDNTSLNSLRDTGEGIYAWCRKGLEDWRIFWLGGFAKDTSDEIFDL